MKKAHITKDGSCHASIKSEEEIEIIRDSLIETENITLLLKWIEGVKDPTRFKLVYLLFIQRQLCVCDLANILNVSSSAVSQHLRKLKDMELVYSKRQNQTLFYSLKNEGFEQFVEKLLGNQGKSVS